MRYFASSSATTTSLEEETRPSFFIGHCYWIFPVPLRGRVAKDGEVRVDATDDISSPEASESEESFTGRRDAEESRRLRRSSFLLARTTTVLVIMVDGRIGV